MELESIRDYCLSHVCGCEECPIFDECYLLFGTMSPSGWENEILKKIEEEIEHDKCISPRQPTSTGCMS